MRNFSMLVLLCSLFIFGCNTNNDSNIPPPPDFGVMLPPPIPSPDAPPEPQPDEETTNLINKIDKDVDKMLKEQEEKRVQNEQAKLLEDREAYQDLKDRAKTDEIVTVVDECNSWYWIKASNYLANHNFYPLGTPFVISFNNTIYCILSFEKGAWQDEK